MEILKRLNSLKGDENNTRYDITTGNKNCCKTTLISELKPITLTEMKFTLVHKGYYFLCQTICSSMMSVGVITLIDSKGEVEQLSLFNFQKSFVDNPNL
jgi:hypothetical protein